MTVAKVRCWKLGATNAALHVALQPRERDPHPEGIWVPRSVCEHVTTVASLPGEWPELIISVEERFAYKKGLLG